MAVRQGRVLSLRTERAMEITMKFLNGQEMLMAATGNQPFLPEDPDTLPAAAVERLKGMQEKLGKTVEAYEAIGERVALVKRDRNLSDEGRRRQLQELAAYLLTAAPTIDADIAAAHQLAAQYQQQMAYDPLVHGNFVPPSGVKAIERHVRTDASGSDAQAQRDQEVLDHLNNSPVYATLLDRTLRLLDSLSDIDRGQYLHNAIDRNDTPMVLAVLRAAETWPKAKGNYIPKEYFDTLHDMWRQKRHPKSHAAIERLRQAATDIARAKRFYADDVYAETGVTPPAPPPIVHN